MSDLQLGALRFGAALPVVLFIILLCPALLIYVSARHLRFISRFFPSPERVMS